MLWLKLRGLPCIKGRKSLLGKAEAIPEVKSIETLDLSPYHRNSHVAMKSKNTPHLHIAEAISSSCTARLT